MTSKRVSFIPEGGAVPNLFIVRGELYEDPRAGVNLKWFIGTVTRNGDPALTCLTTGDVYTYSGGKLPGQIRPVGPGTLTIVIGATS